MRAALDRRLRALEVRIPPHHPADPATLAAVRKFHRFTDAAARDPKHPDHRAALDYQAWTAAGVADLGTLSDAGLDLVARNYTHPHA